MQRSATVFNGGMRVDITKQSLQGVGNAALTLRVQCKGCDEHPGVAESGRLDHGQRGLQPVARLPPGGADRGREPPAGDPERQKVEWRALLDGPAVARMNVDFTSGRATTDGATGGDDPPRAARPTTWPTPTSSRT